MAMRMKDIAASLGVSVSTVSRVLNKVDEGRVSPELRQKIQKYAEKHRYRFNFSARALKKGSCSSIGIVCPYNMYLFNSYTSEIIRGVIDVTNKRKYELQFVVIPEMTDYAERFHDFCASRSVAGVLLQGSLIEKEKNLEMFHQENIPFVILNSKCAERNDTFVDCDNVTGAYEAVKYLIKLGHRKIMHIMGEETSTNSSERYRGYVKALKDNDIPLKKELIVSGKFIEENAYREMLRIINEGSLKFSAIFAANDGMAVGAMRALKEKGHKIPQEVSVVGFDDIPMASYVEPTLTTVSQNLYDIGRIAAETLIEKIETKDQQSRSKIVPCKFIIRDSTRKPGHS